MAASPQIIQAPSGEYHMSVNDELRLVVVAVAPPNQELSYQWFRDGQAMPYARGNELYIPCLQLGDNGVYSCRVSTKLGGSKLIDNCIVQGKSNNTSVFSAAYLKDRWPISLQWYYFFNVG